MGGTTCGKPFTFLSSPSPHSQPGGDAPFTDEKTEAPRGYVNPSGSQTLGSLRGSMPYTGGRHNSFHEVDAVTCPILQTSELGL